jgi:hypothetical protein
MQLRGQASGVSASLAFLFGLVCIDRLLATNLGFLCPVDTRVRIISK